MNWDKFERSKAYFLIPLFVWCGVGSVFLLLGNSAGFAIGSLLFLGGFIITRKHYRKYKRLIQGDKK